MIDEPTIELPRRETYLNAKHAAEKEFDELYPEYQKVVSRVNSLRVLIMTLGDLTNEDVDERFEFQFPSKPTSTKKKTTDGPRGA